MNTLDSTFWNRFILWIVLEVSLNLLGLDELADYGEFLAQKPWNYSHAISEQLIT